MIDALIKLIEPMVTGLGVSSADLYSYAHMLEKYIYAVLIALLVLVAVLIAAHWAKKGTRHVIRWTAVLAWLACLVFVVNQVAYGPMYANISGFLNASKAQIADDVVAQSRNVIKRVGEEGMTLVKNEGILPLGEGTKAINVFGWASTNPIYGGTGSAAAGETDESAVVSILQSLQDAGYQTNGTLSKLYTDYRSDRPVINMSTQDWTLPEPTAESYTAELLEEAKEFSDTAMIVISRSGGENADLPTDMKAVIDGKWNYALASRTILKQAKGLNTYTNGSYTNNGDYDDFDEGEHYLQLSNTEESLVELVCANFDDVIIVVNANNALELGWVDDYKQIGAVILAPGTGDTGMTALGEIISGAVNPSGRTADTFVKDLTAAPYYNNIGNFNYTNAKELQNAIGAADMSYQGVISFVDYVEDIYVGYRFYETAAEEGLIDYESTVQYPFGYGLSYTSFRQEISGFKADGDGISFSVTVTNTGDTAGRDAVEVYFTPPYENGGIEKASVNLLDFAKTGLIEPGKSEIVSFDIPLEELASFDGTCKKTANGGYVLEAGEYEISIRSDSHTMLAAESFTVDADIDYSKDGRASDAQTAENLFADAAGSVAYLSRADHFANFAEATAAPGDEAYRLSDDELAAIQAQSVAGYDGGALEDATLAMPTLGADNGLKLADMRGKAYDDADWDKLLDQMSFTDMATLINQGGWQTAAIDSVGKVATSDCDGPSGLSNYITKTTGTVYPTETLMAMTWSKEVMAEVGTAMGQEFANAENYGWYGPAMNTHRSAFAGRNFEYFSEDGVLAGKLASAEVNGAAAYGVYSYIKHFAVNDQEINRCAFLLTWLGEQAMREIYLKPFEIVVKNFDYDNGVLAVMSSYNWIGTTPSCANHKLLTEVLRNEWGFVGMVETDYDGSYGYMISDMILRAGGDLMLGFGTADSTKLADESSATLVSAMRRASKNILYTVGGSGAYADADAVDANATSRMDRIFQNVNIGAGCGIALLELIVVVRFLIKRKKATA